MVQGPGESGRLLSVHPDVDGILFTGSSAVGQRIVRDNAARLDRLIALELGGKNAAIALDDCDIERTARAIAFAAFASAGQRCTSTSRLIALPQVAAPLIDRIAQIARGIRIGHPLADDVFMGPVISLQAQQALLAAQANASRAGVEVVVAGGATQPDGHEGFYVRPAVHRLPKPELEVAGYTDEELFGPDLCVSVAADLDVAIAASNRSRFGLAAAVFTRSRDAFEHAAEELAVGVVHWNRSSAGASGRLPFGGVKQSGNHRPAGVMTGATCGYAQGILLEASSDSPLPTWPGIDL
jgi:succinylglutamic semialdehyde dehydrogenase